MIHGLTVESDLRAHLDLLQKERLNEKTNTIEGHIVKVVCNLYTAGKPLAYSDIWGTLVTDLEGKLDDKKPNKMDTAEFGEITKQKIGYRLREVLNGKKVKIRNQAGPAIYYDFNAEKLSRIAKKYAVMFVPKFPTDTTKDPPNTQPNKTTEAKTEQKTINPTQNTSSETTPKTITLENSGTIQTIEELMQHTKALTRLTMNFGEDRCLLCHDLTHMEWEVKDFDDTWGLICGSCGLKLSKKIAANNLTPNPN